jgi:hypothetical protein
MPDTKVIVCLANSRKHSGRCVAGKEVLAGGYGKWIRPVSARPSAEISEEERRYENGVLPKVLDIIRIPVIGATPQLYQSENHVIDAEYYWVKTDELSWIDVRQLVDKPAPIWTNNDSTYYGLNDRVKVDIAAKLNNSLMLIDPEDLTIKVVTEGGVWKRQTPSKGGFQACGNVLQFDRDRSRCRKGAARERKCRVQAKRHVSLRQPW